MNPEADALLADLDFAPTCITVNHDNMTVRPQAHWAVHPMSCCGDQVWLMCDDCLGYFTRPDGITRFKGSDHTHKPARSAVRLIQALQARA